VSASTIGDVRSLGLAGLAIRVSCSRFSESRGGVRGLLAPRFEAGAPCPEPHDWPLPQTSPRHGAAVRPPRAAVLALAHRPTPFPSWRRVRPRADGLPDASNFSRIPAEGDRVRAFSHLVVAANRATELPGPPISLSSSQSPDIPIQSEP